MNPPLLDRTSPPHRPAAALAEGVRVRALRLAYGDQRAADELAARLTERQAAGLDPLPTEPAELAPRLLHERRREVRALPSDTRLLLLLAAADQYPVATHAFPRAVAAARLDTRPMEAAEAAGLACATAGGVGFRDAWTRIVVYETASPADRRDVHRLLARVLHGAGEAPRRSWHRAAGALGPSARLAAELTAAADEARAVGDPALSRALTERAAELATDPATRTRLLAQAATDAWHTGDTDRARHLAARAHTDALTGLLTLRTGDAAEAFDALMAGAVSTAPPAADEASGAGGAVGGREVLPAGAVPPAYGPPRSEGAVREGRTRRAVGGESGVRAGRAVEGVSGAEGAARSGEARRDGTEAGLHGAGGTVAGLCGDGTCRAATVAGLTGAEGAADRGGEAHAGCTALGVPGADGAGRAGSAADRVAPEGSGVDGLACAGGRGGSGDAGAAAGVDQVSCAGVGVDQVARAGAGAERMARSGFGADPVARAGGRGGTGDAGAAAGVDQVSCAGVGVDQVARAGAGADRVARSGFGSDSVARAGRASQAEAGGRVVHGCRVGSEAEPRPAPAIPPPVPGDTGGTFPPVGGASHLLARATEAAIYTGHLRRCQEAMGVARRLGIEPPGVLGGIAAAVDGRYQDARELLAAAAGRCGPGGDPTLLLHAGIAALLLGDHTRAATATVRAAAAARARGETAAAVQAMEFRAYADFWTGRPRAAEAAALDALHQAHATGQDNGACHLQAALALFAALTGDADLCRERAATARSHALAHGLGLPAALAQWALAVLDLDTGRHDAAAARLRALAGFGPGHGHRAIRHLATPHYVEAVARTDDTRVARAAHADYDRWARAVRSPDDLALSARCRALLTPGADAVEHYQAALDLHAQGTRDVERARTELLFGGALRRLRRRAEARDRLHSALEAFESFGAPHCAGRARAELRALGAPARGAERSAAAGLTAQQLRVARMAADGATNREIAAQLALSPRTIDHHLRGVFTRLGIRSRIELVRLLGEVEDA